MTNIQPGEEITVLMHCPDKPGLVGDLGRALSVLGFNTKDQVARAGNKYPDRFFMRFDATAKRELQRTTLEETIKGLAQDFNAGHPELFTKTPKSKGKDHVFYPQCGWDIRYASEPIKVGLLISKRIHPALALLESVKYAHEQLERGNPTPFSRMEITTIISNIKENEHIAQFYKIPFKFIPAHKEDRREKDVLKALTDTHAALACLYYLQFTEEFIRTYAGIQGRPIINLHPAINEMHKGLGAHQVVYEHDMLSGATVHFITPGMDKGPSWHQLTTKPEHNYSKEAAREGSMNNESRVFVDGIREFALGRVMCYKDRVELR